MTVNQVSVFIENRQGRLGEVLQVLKDNDVNILSISLADTTEYGLLRLITADNEKAQEVLKAESLIFTQTPVLAVAIDDKAGALTDLLEIFASNDINVHYMYSIFGHQDGKAYMIMQVEDAEKDAELVSMISGLPQ